MAKRPAKYDHAVDTRLNTYACKDELKALPHGAWFDDGVWYVTEADYREAIAIAMRAGPKPIVRLASRFARPVSRFAKRSNNAPHGKRCPMCGSRDCPRAWNANDLCQED